MDDKAPPGGNVTFPHATANDMFPKIETFVNEKPKSKKNGTQIEKNARVFPLQSKSPESILSI